MNPTLPPELQYHILSFVPQRGAYNRIERLDFFVRISQVCKDFHQWVYSGQNGPLKLPKMAEHRYICLRPIFQEINLKNYVIANEAFQDIEKGRSLSECHPLTTNFKGRSLLDETISKNALHKVKSLFSQLSHEELVGYIPRIRKQSTDKTDDYIAILDLFFAEISKRACNDTLAKQAVHPILGKLVRQCRYCKNQSRFFEWIEQKGMKFDVYTLYDTIDDWGFGEEPNIYFKKVLEKQPEILQQTFSCGKRLIHKLFDRNLKHYYRFILEQYPSEITVKDREGKSAISYFLNKDDVFFDKTIFTEKALWDVREECFETLLKYMNKHRLKIFHSYDEKLRKFLETIKDLFADREAFSKWLYSPYSKAQKKFLDELLEIGSLDYHLFTRITPYYNDINTTLELAKMISDFSKENWDKIKKNYSKYPRLEETLHIKLFRSVVNGCYYDPVEGRISIMTEFFGRQWIHFQDRDGNTLLHLLFSSFISSMETRVIPALVYMMDHGFDPNVKNKFDETVHHLAKKNNNAEYSDLIS